MLSLGFGVFNYKENLASGTTLKVWVYGVRVMQFRVYGFTTLTVLKFSEFGAGCLWRDRDLWKK